MSKCDGDCMNCIYSDCILSDEEAEQLDMAEKDRKYKKTYYEKNKEKFKANALKWRKENPEKFKVIQKRAVAKWELAHKLERTQYHKELAKMKKEAKRDN